VEPPALSAEYRDSCTLRKEAAGSSKTLVTVFRAIWLHILDYCDIDTHCWENFGLTQAKYHYYTLLELLELLELFI
jgi:hypothetical protein